MNDILLEMSWFVHIFFKTSTWYIVPIVYALLHSYLDV